MNPFLKAPNILTRRSFLRQSMYAGAGLSAASNAIRDLRLINSAMATQPALTGYKALVCVFLSGGNDSNNWIVPTDATTFDQYTTIRGNLALPSSSLLPMYSTGTTPYQDSDGHTFGFHPSGARLRTLFGEDKLAVLFNVGTLVRPTTRAQYNSGLAAYRPPQLFSHSDQVTQWQTSIPDQPPSTGWGGRVADLVNGPASNPSTSISMSVSVAGSNTFEVGNQIAQYQVSTSGAVVLAGTLPGSTTADPLIAGTGARARALQAINNLTPAQSGINNLQRAALADVTKNAIAKGELLNTNIAASLDPTDAPAGGYTNAQQTAGFAAGQTFKWNTGLTGIYNTSMTGFTDGLGGFPNTTLGTQLKMVARLIKARGAGGFNMKRQIFFCNVGGYDTHTSQVSVNGTDQPTNANGAHYKLLAEVNDCMFAFQRAMEQLGESSNVTAFTASDFSRTLPTNSQGSDHGWGGHHIIVGGAVKGGQTYGHLPTFAVNGPDDTGLGRWIPTLAVDQYSATLAKWFGVDASEMANIFPNLGRFSSSDLGFML
ncbi:MAG: DUF1501 domain-containing protein [Verrucomicrobiaceae bacterium]|nr:DUF1501 domain-containing protein [Verrucomicrobiaceae bacterium]